MSGSSTMDEVFSLKTAFKVVASTSLFLALGAVDLAIWHYMPGGVELFSAVKDVMLENPVAHTVSDVFSSAATMLGGGTEVMAQSFGGAIDPVSEGLLLDLN